MMTKSASFLNLYSKCLAFATAALLFAGGLVTSTGSGLSVPDWPLSYGMFFPPMIGGIRFEHSHRVIAGFVGILTLIYTILIFRIEKRSWMKKLGVFLLFAVLAQAILGGMTVKFLLPDWISITHACLAQTFFTLVIASTIFTSKNWLDWELIQTPFANPIKRLILAMLVFVYAQLIAGAVVRHSGGKGILIHFIIASLIIIHVIFILFKTLRDSRVQKVLIGDALVLLILVLLQIFLGLGSYVFVFGTIKHTVPTYPEVIFRTVHQTNGAFILAATGAILVKAFRVLRHAKP